MGISVQEKVLSALKTYISNGRLEKAKKSNPEFVAAVQKMTANDISFGEQPTLVIGHVKGNCTASGESKYESTTTKRTVAIDFTTDSAVFIAKSNSANVGTCKKAMQIFPDLAKYSSLHNLSECGTLAEKHGKKLARNSLWDLNFSMQEYRLNRFDFVPETNEFKPALWPIFGYILLNGKIKQFSMGYLYGQDEDKVIDIDVNVPLTGKQKLIIWGIVAAVVLAVIVLLMLHK